jgi:hypothetical protein
MAHRRRRRLTQAELQAAGVSAGLIAHRVGPDGRARLEQLAPEGDDRPAQDFIRIPRRLGSEDHERSA